MCPRVVCGPAYGNGDLCRRAGVGSGESFLKAGTGDNGRVRGIVLSRRATNFGDFLAFTFVNPACPIREAVQNKYVMLENIRPVNYTDSR